MLIKSTFNQPAELRAFLRLFEQLNARFKHMIDADYRSQHANGLEPANSATGIFPSVKDFSCQRVVVRNQLKKIPTINSKIYLL